jgi:lysine 2,3-aminomutase
MDATAQTPEPHPAAPRSTPDTGEPDWRRLPGYREVGPAEWESARWQKANAVKGAAGLARVFGPHLSDELAAGIEADQRGLATMAILVPPQMLNTMNEHDLEADPMRRYLLPAHADRHPEWPSHPLAERDSLHEREMWAVEGLTHRYPAKALVELVTTCPQYCGHCTRMDLVGNSTPSTEKTRFTLPVGVRHERMLDYLARTPSVRDVVVSGGDLANVPIERLEPFVARLLEIEHVRDVRLASKSLVGLPQHYLQADVLRALERLAAKARERDVDLALHTHANHARQVTPLVGRATRALLDLGLRDVRNQGVLLRGVNASASALLDLCLALTERARIMPYYLYLCDMIPNAEHWRTSLHEAQELQRSLMGHLPGFATPRLVCDVPLVGKMWVHQADEYDRVTGISRWRASYRVAVGSGPDDPPESTGAYYDPIDTLPAEGQEWWRRRAGR